MDLSKKGITMSSSKKLTIKLTIVRDKRVMKVVIEKDGEGYLAKIEGHDQLFAFAYSEIEAIIELGNVLEMIIDYELEQINEKRLIKNAIYTTIEKYAVQVPRDRKKIT